MGDLEISMTAELLIKQEIERKGPMDFAKFIQLALYHPVYGYYNQKKTVRGRAGDYFTSLQVSSLFPKIMADAIIDMKKTVGTEQFSLVEIGSGDGEFLATVLEELRAKEELKGVRVWSVETSRTAREKLVRALSRFPKCQIVSSLEEIEASGGLEGLLFTNELFDALPFRRLRFREGTWREVVVETGPEGLKEIERAVDPVALDSLNLRDQAWIENQEIEWRDTAPWMNAIGALFSRGYMLTFDYGHPESALYDARRARGTWICYHNHAANTDILQRVGRQDITAHVNFSQLAREGAAAGLEAKLFCSQGIALTHLGQHRLQAELDAAEGAAKTKLTAAIQQLVHPDAMGEAFWLLVQAKGLDLPPTLGAIPNRLRRLAPPKI